MPKNSYFDSSITHKDEEEFYSNMIIESVGSLLLEYNEEDNNIDDGLITLTIFNLEILERLNKQYYGKDIDKISYLNIKPVDLDGLINAIDMELSYIVELVSFMMTRNEDNTTYNTILFGILNNLLTLTDIISKRNSYTDERYTYHLKGVKNDKTISKSAT